MSNNPRAQCDLFKYVGFLLIEPSSVSCRKLGEILDISHDSVNRFLMREDYSARDLFNEVKDTINLKGGIVSVDDTVIDKPYSKHVAYLGFFWSGKHHKSVKGVNLITLYYTDIEGRHVPINFRIYDKDENKTKNDYFCDMLDEVVSWGVDPEFGTTDCWYSCVKNLRKMKKHPMGFQVAVESNRLVSLSKGSFVQIKTLDIPDDGQLVYLKDFGYVKAFRTHLKHQIRHYVVYTPKEIGFLDPAMNFACFDREKFQKLHDIHWNIEQYHRAIKQVCNIESFQVRTKGAVKNHIFSALFAYIELQSMRAINFISNCYELRSSIFKDVIAGFVGKFTTMKNACA
jgi:hypothetical protein